MMTTLELDGVEAFVLTADLKSFTRAAEALGYTQPVISSKIRRLEDCLGRRLLDRTPRLVRLTTEGEAFLCRARALVAAHRSAAGCFDSGPGRLSVGFGNHIVGPDLPQMIGHLARSEPGLVLEVEVGSSRDITLAYQRGDLEAAIVLSDTESTDATLIAREQFGWFGTDEYQPTDGESLHLVAQSNSCRVRQVAIEALDQAGISWREVFVGGGAVTVLAAAAAGLGVAALGRRLAAHTLKDLGERLALPPLPPRNLVLYSRVEDPRCERALQTLCAFLRGGYRA